MRSEGFEWHWRTMLCTDAFAVSHWMTAEDLRLRLKRRRFLSHLVIERHVDEYNRQYGGVRGYGQLTADDLWVIRALVHRIISKGFSGHCADLHNKQYGDASRKRVRKFLDTCPYLVTYGQARWVGDDKRCKRWTFRPGTPGLRENPCRSDPVQEDTDGASGSSPWHRSWFLIDDPWLVHRTVDLDWLARHMTSWRDFCLADGCVPRLDFEGFTNFGRIVMRNLKRLRLPAEIHLEDLFPAGATPDQVKAIVRSWNLVKQGFPDLILVSYLDGRLYSPFSNFPRAVREVLLLDDGSSLGSVDVSFSYGCSLSTLIPRDDHWAHYTDRLGQGDIYLDLLDAAYPAYRTRDEVKLDVMKQILFHVSPSYFGEERVLARHFRDLFPTCSREIARQIYGLGGGSNKRGRSEFSRVLTRIEGGYTIERVFMTLERMGIFAIPLHDCMFCRNEDRYVVKLVMEELGMDYYGFVPKLKFK